MNRLSLDDQSQPPLLSDTPFTASTSGLPSPGLASSTASIEDLLTSETSDGPHPFGHAQDIHTEDVRSDPILNKLAKGQGLIPVSPEASLRRNPSFKAKPAPANMRDQAVGPRMSKAAALRMGMEWEDKKPAGERRQVDFANTPGHKRNNLSMDIASLSSPSMAPRQNRTSQLRSGGLTPSASGPIRHTAEEVSAHVKAKSEEDKARRRQSMVMPSSLSAPSIAPRMNKSSMLRTGGSKPPPTSFDRYLTSTSTNNVPPKPKAAVTPKPKTPTKATFDAPSAQATPKEEKRRSFMGSIRSLGAPSITPRLNKTAMLRTPQSASASQSTIPGLPLDRPPSAVTPRQPPSSFRPTSAGPGASRPPPDSTLSRTSSIRESAPSVAGSASQTGAASAGPRPTRASILRAGLGAKIQAGR